MIRWRYNHALDFFVDEGDTVGFEGERPNELLVVEVPWLKIMRNFPDVLRRSRYGT